MKLRGIIDDMMKQRPTQNNFEDLYKLEGFELQDVKEYLIRELNTMLGDL